LCFFISPSFSFKEGCPDLEAVYNSKVFGSESSNLRLAKFWNWEFTLVNGHLHSKPNEEVGLYGKTLFMQSGAVNT
jgi:hypothetical protein